MEDADSDAEMADYGTDFSDDVDPNFDARALYNRESDPPFSRFLGGFPDSRFPIGRESGIGKRAVSRFGREPGIGVPGRHAGGFLVWAAGRLPGRQLPVGTVWQWR